MDQVGTPIPIHDRDDEGTMAPASNYSARAQTTTSSPSFEVISVSVKDTPTLETDSDSASDAKAEIAVPSPETKYNHKFKSPSSVSHRFLGGSITYFPLEIRLSAGRPANISPLHPGRRSRLQRKMYTHYKTPPSPSPPKPIKFDVIKFKKTYRKSKVIVSPPESPVKSC
jgi:hypothetical protein